MQDAKRTDNEGGIDPMRRNAFWLVGLLALLLIPSIVQAQGQVRVVVNRDFVNIRTAPAFGAEIVATANAGTTFIADAQSLDKEWLRIRFAGSEAWVSIVVITVLEGNPEVLPLRDPRIIPFGGPDAPRAGFTEQTSEILGLLRDTGVRVRIGPGTAYRVIADAPRRTRFPLLGRTADNQWVQVNYDGVLGWVAAQYVDIAENSSITQLAVNGIVATSPPLESTDENDLFGTLRFMRERLDLAQPSLDNQRQIWTNAALGIVPPCGGYPARPSNTNIPLDLRRRYGDTLEPIIRDFDAAMANVRNSIDLQIDVCSEPGSEAVLISPPVVIGGLNFVNDADVLFASLRRRIDELLPVIGPNDCIFEFAGRVDVIPTVPPQAINEGRFTADDRAIGFCFDASPLVIGYLELAREASNYRVVVAVSPLENPSDFIVSDSTGPSPAPSTLVLPQIEFPFEGRYLLIISAETQDGSPPEGDFAFVLVDATLGTPLGQLITFDEDGNLIRNVVAVELADGTIVGGQISDETGANATVTNTGSGVINVFAEPNTDAGVVGQLLPGQTVAAIGTVEGWINVQLSDGVNGWVQEGEVEFNNAQSTDGSGQVQCPGVFLTCNDLISCSEVQACVDAGNTLLDPNGNGIACDSAEGSPPLSCNVAAPLP